MDTAPLAALVRDVPDFPHRGVTFKDIGPLVGSPTGYRDAVDALLEISPREVDLVAAVEARGFLFAGPMALALGAGLVPVRKPGKLPGRLHSVAYDLEYGSTELAVQTEAFAAGARVLVVDDVLATGGTVAASAELVRRLGGELVGVTVLLELTFLGGRARLEQAGVAPVRALWAADS